VNWAAKWVLLVAQKDGKMAVQWAFGLVASKAAVKVAKMAVSMAAMKGEMMVERLVGRLAACLVAQMDAC